MHIFALLVATAPLAAPYLPAPVSQKGCSKNIDGTFWTDSFKDSLKRYEKESRTRSGEHFEGKRAKNVVIMVGDGMGISTVTAARIFEGQRLDKLRDRDDVHCGAEYEFEFEKVLPYSGLAKTYNLIKQTADSASTASAIFSGHKTKHFMLNDGDHCTNGGHETIMAFAKSQGKRTGLVTTTQLYHATPAALYACAKDRWNEPYIMQQFKDLVKTHGVDVALGGGAKYCSDEELRALNATVVSPSDIQQNVQLTSEKPLVGIFSRSALPFIDERNSTLHPTLEEMSRFSVNALARDNPDGFFLMIEGGRIDQAHHKNWAQRALLETAEFDRAFKVVYDELERLGILDDTLIVLTADHSHQFVLGSYSDMGQSLFDPLPTSQWRDHVYYQSKYPTLPWLPITYVTGPGGNWTDIQSDHKANDTHRVDYQVPAFIETDTSTHAGEDVSIFARGPQAHLFSGLHEQTDIFYIMKHAYNYVELPTVVKEHRGPDVTGLSPLPRPDISCSDQKSWISNPYVLAIILGQLVVMLIGLTGVIILSRRVRILKLQLRHNTDHLSNPKALQMYTPSESP